MRLKISFLLVLGILIPNFIFAEGLQLSEEEKQEFKVRVCQKIDEFQSQLGYIASEKSSERTKDVATTAALNLFMGKGDRYYTTDIQTGDRTYHEPVTMQTSSKRTGRKRTQSMKSYLKALRNMTYTEVIIESAGAVRIDNIFQTGDGQYEAIAYFCQGFYGYRDGKLTYNDTTDKAVKVYIRAVEAPEIGGLTWEAYLGDVSVVSTR